VIQFNNSVDGLSPKNTFCVVFATDVKENPDDPMPHRSGSRLREVSGVLSVSSERRHRRLQSAGTDATEAAARKQEVTEKNNGARLKNQPGLARFSES
jgi:hypothetical protein